MLAGVFLSIRVIRIRVRPGRDDKLVCPERKAVEGFAHHFGPRIPDFLSRLVASSKALRLSLRESRMRGRAWCCVVDNPGNAGANMGTRRSWRG
jgi:hypothetical protein